VHLGPRTRTTTSVVLAVLLLAGCGGSSIVLPEVLADCRSLPVRAVLHFDAQDPRQIWATRLDAGGDIVVRPRGDTGWRLDPGPPTRLVDAAGRDVGRDGDILRSVCFDAIMGSYYIGPDDLPSPDRPPN
jgi:hypothetical protein